MAIVVRIYGGGNTGAASGDKEIAIAAHLGWDTTDGFQSISGDVSGKLQLRRLIDHQPNYVSGIIFLAGIPVGERAEIYDLAQRAGIPTIVQRSDSPSGYGTFYMPVMSQAIDIGTG